MRVLLIAGVVLGAAAAALLAQRSYANDAPLAWNPLNAAPDDALAGNGLFDYALFFGASDAPYVGAPEPSAALGVVDTIAATIYDVTGVDVQEWQQVANRPENKVYLDALHAAESRNGIPRDLLVRLAYQESRFRPDIISGATVSSANAQGIMQIVPRWHPDVNPLDPIASINYAGKFLAGLYRTFGRWELALKAYNWGAGNVRKWLAGNAVEPSETQRYSAEILADLADSGQVIA